MQSDRHRLLKQWQRLQAGKGSEGEQEKWQARLEASAERYAVRERLLPDREYDSDLPITAHRDEIINLVRERQTIVVCGETGSGKSTQLPKFLLDAGYGVSGLIGHTQPRRLAARSVAARLAEELKTTIGELVGFKIRFTDATKQNTLIKLMTDGVLLAETQSDRFLDQYDALIIDEAHERSLNIDFLMGYLRKTLARRPDLKLIITSATIDPEKFANHFADEKGPAPIIEVSGRTYPVELRYRPPEHELDGERFGDDDEQSRAIAAAVDELEEEGSGDILTFLPTERDIRATAKYLRGHFAARGQEKSVEILPLYARLTQAEQNKIFAGHSKRRIVLSTNVAESSLTVPGIRYVIDTGLVRISRYAPRSRVRRLPIETVSQASANQRSGRCGRVGPGVCIRLYEEEDFEKRPKFTTPEIKRSDLASVILQCHTLNLGKLEELPLLDAPTPEALRDGKRTLFELGATEEDDRLTKVGRQLGKLPCDPRVGRMLLEADQRNCLAEVVVIAAAIECQDVRQRPAGQRPQADEAHAIFNDPHSDFLSYLRLYRFFEDLRGKLGRSRLQKALQQKFLSYQSFREWSDIIRQLKDILSDAKMRVGKLTVDLPKIDPEFLEQMKERGGDRGKKRDKGEKAAQPKLKRPEGYAAIHQSLLSGLLRGIAQKGDRHEYKAAGGLEVALWPGSGLFQRQPRWVVASEVIETSKRYARTVAEVDVEWIEQAGKRLLKHSYSDPHWSSKTGNAMVYRRSTLFGLPVVAGRRTQLAPLDAETARRLLIEHGLVAGEWRCNEAFYQHNQELLEDIAELAKRTRSRDYIVDHYHMINFYNQHLPLEVVDLRSLQTWMKANRDTAEAKNLWLAPSDLLQETPGSSFEESYPNEVQIGKTSLPLNYHFEPGSEKDGVTVTVPQVALKQVSEEALGWLIPGLLEEKILHLIKSLPKSLRTNFVPAPDVARVLASEVASASRDEPFSTALCRVMRDYSGEVVRATDFDPQKLPQHLRFLVRVVDDAGKEIATSREIVELQDTFALHTPELHAPNEEAIDWKNRQVDPGNFEDYPESIRVRSGGVMVSAFPTLFDLGERVELRLCDNEAESTRQAQRGMTRLFAIKHSKSLRNQVRHLPNLDQAKMRLSHLLAGADLRAKLRDLLARAALVDDQSIVRSQIDYEARNADASRQISIATQDIAQWLPKFSEQVQALRLQLEKLPDMWREVGEDIESQKHFLFGDDFLTRVPWSAMKEYPRYLQAIVQRIDKLKSGGLPKDRKQRAPIEKLNDQLNELREGKPDSSAVDSIGWMIEEFRVSVFAQNLGTRQPVSEKRIREAIERLS